jgi:hypothetical protein
MNTNRSTLATRQPLTIEAAIATAPAIGATQPAPPPYVGGARSKYVFTPSTDIISTMNSAGFDLVSVSQNPSKNPIRNEFGAHIMRFQTPSLSIRSAGADTAKPEVVIINSHDGTKHITVEMGIFRLVCSNGLMIKSQDFGGFRQRHQRITPQSLMERISAHTDTLPSTIDRINGWAGREMSSAERRAFARQAITLRLGEEYSPAESDLISLLEPKREADNSNDVWSVFNVVQENLIRGGFQANERTARGISNPWVDMAINQSLWSMAEELLG